MKTENQLRNIRLIEKHSKNSVEAILQASASDPLFVCDFYVEDIERGQRIPAGYQSGRVINIDHHAPTDEMSRVVSSTNLVLQYVAEHGQQPEHDVLINHCDCDSVLSSGVLSGVLEPRKEYGQAALIADHKGDENPIADLLQSIEHARDLSYSFECLALLEAGKPLPPSAEDSLINRKRLREKAQSVVAQGKFQRKGPLAYAVLDERVDAELFLPLFPDAAIVMYAFPRTREGGKFGMKVRLGKGAPEGLNLHKIGIRDFDPAFGGRWNAGSNTRGGGTDLDPEIYAQQLADRLEDFEAQS